MNTLSHFNLRARLHEEQFSQGIICCYGLIFFFFPFNVDKDCENNVLVKQETYTSGLGLSWPVVHDSSSPNRLLIFITNEKPPCHEN